MEAHEVKYGTKVKVSDNTIQVPPDSLDVRNGDIITILKLDGMYCNAKDKDGNKIYIAAWTNVVEV